MKISTWCYVLYTFNRAKRKENIVKLLIAVWALAAGLAHAETITLSESPGFGYLRQYHNVINDAGAQIDFYAPGVLILDGVHYYEGDGATFTASDGTSVTLFYSEYSIRKQLNGSGRAGYRWITKWTLLGGTIER